MRREAPSAADRAPVHFDAIERSNEFASAPELLSAVQRQCANFSSVVLAHYYRLPRWNRTSPDDRRLCADALPELLEQFEERHGRIAESYFCRNALAAAVLTDEDEIGLVWGAGELQFPERTLLLFECRSLAYTAWHRLSRFDRKNCQMIIFGVITEVLRRMDRRAASGEKDQSAGELQYLRDELERARRFYRSSAEQLAQVRYTIGMLFGLVTLGAILVPFVTSWAHPPAEPQTLRAILLTVIAGATGAAVSVLARMTFSKRIVLSLPNFEAARRNLWFLGGLRPFVGAIFGLALYVLLNSTLLPITLPADPVAQVFFFTSVAFLAGFSERFAQDVFLRSGRAIAAEAPPQGPVPPTPEPTPADGAGLNGTPARLELANGILPLGGLASSTIPAKTGDLAEAPDYEREDRS